jgi:glucosamine-6-phosphate deaminase
MRVIVLADAEQVVRAAASRIAELVRGRPAAVLGLATGGTVQGVYRELIRLHRECDLRFAQVRSFNLDEYLGLPHDHPQSYHTFMREQLFDHIDLPEAQRWIPDGMAADPRAHGQWYEERIAAAGGIDLQLLGIGRDGHIGFNEPGSSLASRTRVKALTQQTREDNARFFGSVERVPPLAITMGVGTILAARECLLLATGESKAVAVAAMIEGPLMASVPATALQLHPRTTVLVDRAAAGRLQRIDYYLAAEAAQESL